MFFTEAPSLPKSKWLSLEVGGSAAKRPVVFLTFVVMAYYATYPLPHRLWEILSQGFQKENLKSFIPIIRYARQCSYHCVVLTGNRLGVML